jgi:hypothetical protein
MSVEMSAAGYVICIGIPVLLVTTVLFSVLRNATARRILFVVIAVQWIAVLVLLVAWSLRVWPVWFFTVPAAAGLLWALREGGRRTFAPRSDK